MLSQNYINSCISNKNTSFENSKKFQHKQKWKKVCKAIFSCFTTNKKNLKCAMKESTFFVHHAYYQIWKILTGDPGKPPPPNASKMWIKKS